MPYPPSELILNSDGSVFHLALVPEQLADLVFLVGDPGRVARVSQHFDRLEHQVQKREFITHTGWMGDRRISVISSGIGTDNIDIVLSELDILANVDLQSRTDKPQHRSLQLIRLGTSGAYQSDIVPGQIVVSQFALGFDVLMHFYASRASQASELVDSFIDFADQHGKLPVRPYAYSADKQLFGHFASLFEHSGITLTLPGFYGPQGRQVRTPLHDARLWESLPQFRYEGHRITNFEMESSGIFGLSRMLGHRAVSVNLILANRLDKQFHPDPAQAMSSMIEHVLSNLPD